MTNHPAAADKDEIVTWARLPEMARPRKLLRGAIARRRQSPYFLRKEMEDWIEKRISVAMTIAAFGLTSRHCKRAVYWSKQPTPPALRKSRAARGGRGHLHRCCRRSMLRGRMDGTPYLVFFYGLPEWPATAPISSSGQHGRMTGPSPKARYKLGMPKTGLARQGWSAERDPVHSMGCEPVWRP